MVKNSKKRILVVAANPKNTSPLRLAAEVKEIDQAIQQAKKRSKFEVLKPCLAATYRDFSQAVLEANPHIVHFCGHGEGDKGLVLEDITGQATFVDAITLAGLFELFQDQVECVLLNACYSEVQAEVIKQHIDYVIGMNQPVGDRAAIEFAVGFYDALGTGRDYEFAYNFGCNRISLPHIQQADIPILKKKPQPEPDFNPSIWIHAWKKPKQGYGDSPTVELDWTQYFDIDSQPRRIADQATWDNILQPSLLKARKELPERAVIDVRGLLPLTTAVSIGTVFPDTLGYILRMEQRTTAQNNLWRSDAKPSDAKFKIVQEDGEIGEHLLVALGITGDASRDVDKLRKNSPIPFNSVVYAEPEFGTGERAIRSNEDVTALVIHAKEIIRQYRHKYDAICTHLVVYAPVSFCLFLGQRLRVVGDVICYERVADRNYQPSVKLCTG
ncbi:SAVED domain-containing protein [Tolypothrix sp. PCC 7910]|uniref:SAVED domain-containing protein n=1 Tax=Tolypothrix sp. PCC 7910 TaxID=2099387 RepID=UPI0014279FD8|nr:SAVED domain-containing protein [Tolypothrix sp. PCC 7910]QIR37251.1 SAVED domain-containing protein [Tolypothrix sp. PCC 7910]